MNRRQYRLRVQKAAGRWRWRCHWQNRVHTLDHENTQPEALAAGLAHMATHYPKDAA